MGFPTVTQTWLISGNNRYSFPVGGSSTVQGCMQAVTFSIKAFLKTNGYTIKGSCSAGTGAMDGVDRWASAASVTPRNNGAGGSQAWVVLTDGNGVDICMSYNSSADDIFRFSFSPGGLYVAAGTPNQQPTATDEVPIWNNAITMVGTSTTRDRVWHLWCSSDRRMFRCVLYLLGVPICSWGVEKVTSAVLSPSTFSPATWGWAYMNDPRQSSSTGSLLGAGQSPPVNGGGGVARVTVPVNGTINAVIGGGGEHFGSVGGQTDNGFVVAKPELQGGLGQIWVPLTCVGTTTATVSGRLGVRIDWWAAYTTSPSTLPARCETFDSRRYVAIGSGIMPWDGVSGPVGR
jgi:hypothetical protein